MIPRILFLLFIVLAPSAPAQTPEWIWFNKTDGSETRFFRKTFSVSGTPSKADLVATADDGLEVFINGARVLKAAEWGVAHKANVTTRVKPGRNVIAIRADNGDSSAAGAIARLTITTPAGPLVVVTDATWKASDKSVADWNQSTVAEATWSNAKSLGKLGVEPWNDVFSGGSAQASAKQEATPADALFVANDFKVELLHSGDPEEGSWVNMCKDNQGRLILSPQYRSPNPDGGLLRITLGADGQIAKREFIARPLYDAQGMVFANGALWVVVNKYSTQFQSGLYRITDDGSDTWSQIELLKTFPGGGEHGPHAIELGPDGNLYIMAGNHTKLPEGISPTSPHRNYAEDQVLPRQWDGNGHAAGILAPGGYILKVSPDTKKVELFCAGFRNQFDFAFNVDDELFAYDADMEWDWGMPWYRPTRVNHAVSGAEFGWRSGTGKWPDDYPDSLGAIDIGIGCPTGVASGRGAKFPAKYQRALYIMDWTFGRLMAVHLKPDGATYTGTFENFVCPAGLVREGERKPPLNVTDLVVGNDGAMYFTIGGRNTASGLYRVTYTGTESTAPANQPNAEGADARQLRRQLEAFHGHADPKALDFLWPHLSSPDRSIRYAARIALEAQPLETWRDRALNETNADAGVTALLALARVGGKAAQDASLKALGKWPMATLSEPRQIDKLRVIEVSIARNGLPSPAVQELGMTKLSASYPNNSPRVNKEIAQILIALGAPDVVEKTLKLLANARTQEDAVDYLFHLTTAKNWTLDQRREYFAYWAKEQSDWDHPPEVMQWFAEAGRPYGNGASFNNFLKNFRKEAENNLSDEEKTELTPLLAALPAQLPAGKRSGLKLPQPTTRQHVREWKISDFASELPTVGSGRNFERGLQAFVDAQCLSCHRFVNDGGGVGPDLTAVSSRFSRRDILESILEPSKVLSEQFVNTTVDLKNGEDVTGRIIDETSAQVVLVPDPLKPDQRITVKTGDIASRHNSALSPMPEGLLNTLSKEEILDLLAFLQSGGRAKDTAFAN